MYESSMAEAYFRYGFEDFVTKICLAPDAELWLFLDGSAVYLTKRALILFDICWSTSNF